MAHFLDNTNLVRGRNALGGGARWKRAGQMQSVQSELQGYAQTDLADHLQREEQARQDLWEGRGIGRGPLWPENHHGFREIAGWTRASDVKQVQIPEYLQRPSSAQAVLQVFKSYAGKEKLKDCNIQDQTSIGREANCSIILEWDGISRRHACFEAREQHSPERLRTTERVEKRHPVLWSVTGTGGNGTFLNSVRLRNGEKFRIRDGDTLSFGKGRDVKDGNTIEEKELVYIFVFRESSSDGVIPSLNTRKCPLLSQPAPTPSVEHNHPFVGHDHDSCSCHPLTRRSAQQQPPAAGGTSSSTRRRRLALSTEGRTPTRTRCPSAC
jgi:pSer/pThr/pTyr-binding forkhead associated (FHA) protein